MTTTSKPDAPANDEVNAYFERLNNWGRWGPDDEMGTVNLITDDCRRAAAALVKSGRSLSCALPIPRMQAAPGLLLPVMHFMLETGDGWDSGRKQTFIPPGMQAAVDYFGMIFHGTGITHLDSPAHIFWEGKLYNGFPSEAVSSTLGATKGGVDVLYNGVVGRGVLLDIPRLTGRQRLDDGEGIGPAELEAAEEAAKLRVRSGDILYVRTGVANRPETGEMHTSNPGLHAGALPWLRERDVAVLGSDAISDVGPSGYDLMMPIHQVGIAGLGLWLVDNMALEPLAQACEEEQRWEFLSSIAPLRLQNATGSPVNPTAVF